MNYKFDIGNKVVYDGLIATIESRDVYAGNGLPCYGLVADSDSELTCTADERECESYDGQDVDEREVLSDARFFSERINVIKGVL